MARNNVKRHKNIIGVLTSEILPDDCVIQKLTQVQLFMRQGCPFISLIVLLSLCVIYVFWLFMFACSKSADGMFKKSDDERLAELE